jgi:hypothetical protein
MSIAELEAKLNKLRVETDETRRKIQGQILKDWCKESTELVTEKLHAALLLKDREKRVKSVISLQSEFRDILTRCVETRAATWDDPDSSCIQVKSYF